MLLPEEGNKPLNETLWLETSRVIYDVQNISE
jgi:hypothetical protein